MTPTDRLESYFTDDKRLLPAYRKDALVNSLIQRCAHLDMPREKMLLELVLALNENRNEFIAREMEWARKEFTPRVYALP